MKQRVLNEAHELEAIAAGIARQWHDLWWLAVLLVMEAERIRENGKGKRHETVRIAG